MRLVDADNIVKIAEHAYYEWNLAMAAADGAREINKVFKKQELYKTIKTIVERAPTINPESFVTGETSDGYHTFNELYHHRAVLFSVICNTYSHLAWKSKRHHDPDSPMYDGMFIVGIETPSGQATYHYDIEPYWDMFRVNELPCAPEWDGHTPDEAIRRIGTIDPECGAKLDKEV